MIVATASRHRATIPRTVDERAAIWERVKRRMQVGLSAANLIGGLIVFVFLTFLVPAPTKFNHDTSLLWLNVSLVIVGGPTATFAGNKLGEKSVQEVRDWFLSGEPADARQRELALRTPLRRRSRSHLEVSPRPRSPTCSPNASLAR